MVRAENDSATREAASGPVAETAQWLCRPFVSVVSKLMVSEHCKAEMQGRPPNVILCKYIL